MNTDLFRPFRFIKRKLNLRDRLAVNYYPVKVYLGSILPDDLKVAFGRQAIGLADTTSETCLRAPCRDPYDALHARAPNVQRASLDASPSAWSMLQNATTVNQRRRNGYFLAS